MTDPMKLDAQQAVQELRIVADILIDDLSPGRQERVRAALAALDGKHVYVSDFAVGDKVWFTYMERVICEPVFGVVFAGPDEFRYWLGKAGQYVRQESDCFPTRAEAEAEAALRNAETHKERE